MSAAVTRRARINRWIISLHPLIKVVSSKAWRMGLGEPRIESGPGLMPAGQFEDRAGDRIRKGAVWFIAGVGNCGFHVDFCANGQVHIEAWQGAGRRVSLWISGDLTEQTLKRDLTLCMAAAGLSDLARTEEVRAKLFSRKKSERG